MTIFTLVIVVKRVYRNELFTMLLHSEKLLFYFILTNLLITVQLLSELMNSTYIKRMAFYLGVIVLLFTIIVSYIYIYIFLK